MKTLGVIVAVMASAPVAAQVAPGRFAPRSSIVTQTELSAAMGSCALAHNHKASERLVRTKTSDPAFRRALDQIYPTMIACVKGNGSATLNGISLRGTIAEGLVQEHDGAVLTQALAAPSIAPTRVPVHGEGMQQAIIACAVAATPSAAVGRLRANPGTPAEAAAFRLLVPALQACVPLTGEVRIKPFEVRPLAAIALYQRFGGIS